MILIGVLLKMAVADAERYLSTRYVDECMAQYHEPSQEQKIACFSAPQHVTSYTIVAALNFQPEFWKNTAGRCVGVQTEKQEQYFQCGWWNRFAL